MGNCYATENNQDIETSLTNTKTLAKQRANAGIGITDDSTPGIDDVPVIDAAGFQDQTNQIIREV